MPRAEHSAEEVTSLHPLQLLEGMSDLDGSNFRRMRGQRLAQTMLKSEWEINMMERVKVVLIEVEKRTYLEEVRLRVKIYPIYLSVYLSVCMSIFYLI